MADTDAARIGDVKAGFVTVKADVDTRMERDGSNVAMDSTQAAAFRAAIGVGGGGGGGGDVVGPAGVPAGADRLAAFDGTTGKLLKAGPTFGEPTPLSLIYRAQAESEFQPKDGGLTALAGLADPGIYYLSAPDAWSKVTVGSGLTFTGGVLDAPGGGGGGNVVGPATVTAGRLAAFNGTNGREIIQGPSFGDAGPLSLLYRVQAEAEFQPISDGLTSLDGASVGSIVYKSSANTWSPVTIGSGLTFSGGTLFTTGGGGPPLSNTAPPALGTAAAGTSTDAARGDHVHAHGNQSGGSLHSAATTSVNGFMSSTDKSKLDGIATGATANATNAQLRDRSTHTGQQLWSTISDPPAITGLTASQGINANTVAQRNASGWLYAARFRAVDLYYYFTNADSVYMRFVDPNINFSHSATGPAFTPSSDPRLKRNMAPVSDDAAALSQIIGARQFTYTRKQDDVFAAGFNALELRALNPLWTVGGEPVAPAEAEERGAVKNEDGSWEMPLAVDPMAIISSMAGAIRELERRLAAIEGVSS